MGNAVLKNPRVVTVTDPIFGPRKEAQADLYNVVQVLTQAAMTHNVEDREVFVCVVSLGKPVETEEPKTVPVCLSCGKSATMKYVRGEESMYFCNDHTFLIGSGIWSSIEQDEEPAPPSAFRPTT